MLWFPLDEIPSYFMRKHIVTNPTGTPANGSTVEQIEAWLIAHLAARRGVAPHSIDVRERFSHYGLDSLGATGLLAELAKRLGRPLSPTLVWEHPTIRALSRHLAGGESERTAPRGDRARAPSEGEPIAIVGLSCRVPKGPDAAAFWRLLREGVDAITEVPPGRWDVGAFYDEDPGAPGKMSTRWGGFLEQVDGWDAEFFGVSPREAVQMDPQQRLMMELSWEALEDAGIAPDRLKGSQTGVFLGAMWTDYAKVSGGSLDGIVQHTATGQDLSIIPARISYSLGLQGPSVAVSTACSSSLVAVHLACQSLRLGESTLALAGGVNLILAPESTIAMSKFGAMAPDGRSKAFDARANGYVRGEGGGVVVLKPLSRALADGDPIYCVIRGSAVNNDGFSNGLTAPNPQAQEAVLREAYQQAGVAPEQVHYVEAHGTGTILGDPIEASALGAVLGAGRPAERALRLGSVKTNIGHLEAAAGIAGLIKVALSMRHRLLPPSLHFQEPNPHIAFEDLRLSVQRGLEAWPEEERPALAGVSSFGFGGTNCHVVVEGVGASPPQVLPLSAESPDALRALAQEVRALAAAPGPRTALPELCAAFAARDDQLPVRLAWTARSHDDLRAHAEGFLAGPALPGTSSGRVADGRSRLVFVFGGQGSQWLGMGRDLLRDEPAFRVAMRRCEQAMRSHVEWSLLEVLSSGDARMLEDSDVVQPAIFAIQVALAALWRSWGIEPDAVIGQSMGEVAAACVAGALSLEDAAQVICQRSRLVKQARGRGGMAVVELSVEEAERALEGYEGRLSVAVSTSPKATVLSGDRDALDELAATLRGREVSCRHIKVDYASHSPHMDGLRPELLRALTGIRPRCGQVPFYSTVTGAVVDGTALDAAYWARNLREPVRFAQTFGRLLDAGHDLFLELDPHPLLAQAMEEGLTCSGREGAVLPSLRRDEAARAVLLDSLGALYTRGRRVDWPRLFTSFPPGARASSSEGSGGSGARRGSSARSSQPVPGDSPPRAHLLPLSAKSPEALASLADVYRGALSDHSDLDDIAYTASARRSHHEHRLAVVGASKEEIAAALAAFGRGERPSGLSHGRAPGTPSKVVFVFSGQGSQWAGMGRALLAEEPAFRATVEACEPLVQRYAGFSLLAELTAEEEASRLGETEVAQPAIFAMQVALSALWASWGVVPDAVIGHSVGEVAAAHISGALELEEAVRLVCTRGRVMQRATGLGKMASVALPEEPAARALRGYEDRLAIGAVNDPGSVVLSGEAAALAEVLERLERQGVEGRMLRVDYAFHGPQMEPLAGELARELGGLAARPGALAMYSTVEGGLVEGGALDAAYWPRNVREPVRFARAVEAALGDGYQTFVEVGPHPVLSLSVERCLSARGAEGRAIPTLRRDQGGRGSMLSALAKLYAHGHAVDFGRLYPEGGRVVALPAYPWQRKRYWIEGAGAPWGARATRSGHPLLGARIAVAGAKAVFEAALGIEAVPYLAEHRVFGQAVVPGTGLLELARAAGEALGLGTSSRVEGLVVGAPLSLPEQGWMRVQVVVSEATDAGHAVTVYSQPLSSRPEGGWTEHAVGRLRAGSGEARAAAADLDAARARCGTGVDVAELYGSFEGMGLSYGPAFRGLEALWRGAGEVVARVALPGEAGEGAASYGAHPALLDAALQALVAVFGTKLGSETYLPWEIGGFVVRQPGVTSAWVHARATGAAEGHAEVLSGDVVVLDDGGAVVAELSQIRLKRASAAALRRAMAETPREDLYAISWQERRPAGDGTGPSGAWLLLYEPSEGAALARALEARLLSVGVRCTIAELSPPGSGLRVRGSIPREAGAIGAALDEAGPGLQGVVCLWGGGAGASTAERAEAASLGALALVQELSRRGDKAPPRLVWVTEAAQAVRAGEPAAAAAASLWGLGRSVMLERPELGCTLVDLEPGAGDAVEALWHELGKPDDEREIAWRTGQRHVARLCRVAARSGLSVPDAPSYRLEIAQKGLLDQLRLLPAERRAPGPGEIEIEVKASGLNFRDVIRALDMDRSELAELGHECAGVVTALGEGVQHLAVGDAVMAIAPGAFRRFVTVDARLASPQPSGLSAAEAAALPIVFLTAWYALHELGGLKRGERLLLHAAAGGVGMAAVQVAQWLGAEVLATASPSKWGVVRAMGVERVESSRTLGFADAYRTAGVDVVLNALAGEFVDASLSLLSAGGRFLEMGKTDIRSAEAVGAAHPGVVYRAFDLLEVGPDRIQQMFRRVSEGFAAGWLRPLPVRAFPVTEAEAALRFMAQARHTGKIVLLPAPKAALIAPQSTVLITGGLGALGLQVARWLWQEHGVQHLVLAGRRAPEGAQGAAVEALREAGARVTVVQADVADAAAVQALVSSVPAELPLRGVIHAAGVLEDGVLSEQTEAQYAKVFAPKARGAWNLHEATRALPLELFVLFSSSASLLGAAGQANYAAANAYLDGLAQMRWAEGLPAQSVSWGPWADGGMVETLGAQHRARFGRMGVGALAPAQGLSLLGRALSRPEAHLGALELDLRALGQALGADVPPIWRALVQPRSTQAAGRASAPTQESWAARLAALSPEARAAEVDVMVRTEAARVLSLPSSGDLSADRPLKEVGLDSLMALELRNALSARVGKALPATLLFDRPTVAALRRYLLDEVLLPGEQKAPLAAVQPRIAPREEPIAIVGIGCRFPGGVHDLESFWRLLEGEVDAVREVPRERWDIDAYYDPDPEAAGKMVTRWGGFLEDVDRFDPAFFGISPREAASIDPQQRLLLETTWEALERAGISAEALAGSRTGVYVGICGNDYQGLMFARGADRLDPYSFLGSAHSATVGRLSYWLGLQGPNMAVDTACSSSLVAVHLACQALRSGECTTALAGGVNLVLTPELTVYFSRMRAMSPSGRCHAFSADADGYVRGEGCGVLVLKRLSDAERDGDPILAVIRGSAVNQDGRSQGLTAPNGPAQEAVIRQALAQAGMSPASVGYVETHGTGTPLGDPIEAQALGAVLGEGRPAGAPLWIGSVKTNIGHTEGAAGVAGLIKAVLALSHERIPRSLHFTAPNPHIAWSELPLQVVSEPVPWPANCAPRRAGVSSFGFSGTNAHVLLEEAPRRALVEAPANEAMAYLLPLSAKSPEALSALAATYATFLPASDARLGDIVYTASVRRSHHEHRLAVAGGSKDELAAALAAYARGERAAAGVLEGKATETPPKVVFVFPGQGSQWAGMGRQLFAEEPAFRQALEACDQAIRREAGFSAIEVLAAEDSARRLEAIDVVQPVLFAIEVALAALWRAWGVEPDAVVGHSMGEVAAAHVAGALSLEDAVAVICRRSRLLRAMSGRGAMALVELSMTDAERALAGYEDRLSVAVSNGPQSTVIAGDPEALGEVLAALEARSVFCKRVKVDVASHSPSMDPLCGELLVALQAVAPMAARVPMRSTVTTRPLRGHELSAGYWADNLRRPVRFSQVVQRLIAEGHALFVEMSPHPILLPSVEENLREVRAEGAAIASLRRGQPELLSLLESIGRLYVHGHPVSWQRLPVGGGRVVGLPSYPWQRQRCWLEGVERPASRPKEARALPQDEAAHPSSEVAVRSEAHVDGEADTLAGCVYDVAWRRAEPLPEATLAPAGAWLIFADQGGVGAALCGHMRSKGQQCVLVSASAGFERVEPDRYGINPTKADDYRRLLHEAFGDARRCSGAVHLFSLDAVPFEATTAESLAADLVRGSVSAAVMVQALAQDALLAPRLFFVTRGAQRPLPSDAPWVSQAPLLGLAGALALEHPELGCKRIDMDAAAGVVSADALFRELAANDGEDQVALRGGDRYVARLVRGRLEADVAAVASIRGDATYLITGGLGGLGLALARWLVGRGARHLALVGRRAPGEDAQTAIQAMEAAGARIAVLQADVSRRDDVARVVAEITATLPELRGVVHAAAVLDDRTVLELSEESFRRVFAPKALGAWNLHELSAGLRLDFFVLYSSAASLLGSPGQGNYSAANAFLDALARRRERMGLPAMSIQWGAFSEVGLAAARQNRGERLSARGLAGLTPGEGLDALARLLDRPRPEVAIARLDARRWAEAHGADGAPFWAEMLEAERRAAPATSIRAEIEQRSPGEAAATIERLLVEEVGRVLRLAPSRIARTDRLRYLGFDSLMALELKNRLQSALGIQVTGAALLRHDSIAAIASHLFERMALGPVANDVGAVPAPRMIEPAPEERHRPFPLTDIQQAYWLGRGVTAELGGVGCHYYIELESEGLDVERLSSAWAALIERHDMLRAVILPDGEAKILEEVPPYAIATIDLRGRPADVIAATLTELRETMSHRLYAPHEWPLFDIRAAMLPGGRVRVHFSIDLLIVDATSMLRLFAEWRDHYQDPHAPRRRLSLSFRDYVLAEAALAGSDGARLSDAYWLERIPTLPNAPELPRLPIQPGQRARFTRRAGTLERGPWQRLKELARRQGATPSEVLCAAFSEVLAAWSRSPRFCIVLTASRRLPLHPEVEDLVGEFTSTILLEVDAAPGTFEQRAARLWAQLRSDLDHLHTSGVRVLRELNRARGQVAENLVPIVFTSALGLQKDGDWPMRWLGETVHGISQTPQVCLDHSTLEEDGRLLFNWDAIDAAFPEGLLDAMFDAYGRLLRQLAADDAAWSASPAELLPVPAPQLEQRARANATSAPISSALLHTLFADQARRSPAQEAVASPRRRISYGELHDRAARVGRRLRELGAERGRLVAVVMDKGWEQVVAVLGVLMSGAAYLPIDAAVPPERLHALLEHAEARLVLTQTWVDACARWPADVQRLSVDDEAAWASVPAERIEPLQAPEDLAYVIYTSGSTGTPKGVRIDHRGAVNTILDVNQRFGVGPGDRVLALSSLSFDLSVYDVFGVLAAGGTIVLPEHERRLDPAHWTELLAEERVSLWNSVPALMEIWVEHAEDRRGAMPASFRLAMLSGDWIPVTLPDRIRSLAAARPAGARPVEVISLGGATEASIWSILYPIERVDPRWKSIPYGRPMVNQRFDVLDDALDPCPDWVPGHLYIGGIGLAQGYHRDEAETRRSFIVHPRTGERLYRTGDMGRYLPGGDIEFLGRRDTQVKVGGHRIELGEIEAALVQHPRVVTAAVVVKGDPRGQRRLAAYVVPAPDGEAGIEEALRGFLRTKLPEYMVPAAIVAIDALPLTGNGKVDRGALTRRQDAAPPFPAEAHAAPQDGNEAQIAAIVAEVLGLDEISVQRSFFDLGASSIQLVRIANRIRKALQVELPIVEMFRRPNVRELSSLLSHPGVEIGSLDRARARADARRRSRARH
ncbi:amino acid adenylation domain-containing protein [Sorangium sp. So ce233]|uniref:amino acid adenylation domain-containing protein n=1 Tax=Sorangium sp. So ce233 TaxID=3133290 RepID=UPI003F63291A